MGRQLFCFLLVVFCLSSESQAQIAFRRYEGLKMNAKTETLLPQNFYNRHLPFFCKKESQLQGLTGLNLFIRLGSKTYVDYLEQKPHAKASWPAPLR